MADAIPAVPDISCGQCAQIIDKVLSPTDGLHDVAVDISAERVRAEHDSACVGDNRTTEIVAGARPVRQPRASGLSTALRWCSGWRVAAGPSKVDTMARGHRRGRRTAMPNQLAKTISLAALYLALQLAAFYLVAALWGPASLAIP